MVKAGYGLNLRNTRGLWGSHLIACGVQLQSSLHNILRRFSPLTASVFRRNLGGGGPGKFSARQEKPESKDEMQQIARHQEVYAW